jgi:hydroxymethylbilane synthase
MSPGPAADGDPVDLGQGDAGVRQRPGDEAVDDLDVGTRGDLRHHAAVGRMLGDLAQDLVREDVAATVAAEGHHGGGGFVAGRLDAEDAHGPKELATKRAASRGGRRSPIVRPAGPAQRRCAGRAGVSPWRTARDWSSAPAAARLRWRRRMSAGPARGGPRLDLVALPLSVIKTTGDAIQDRPLSEAGGKGLFTKELDAALLEGAIDLAVHSAKDLPTACRTGLRSPGYLPREDARDAFISLNARSLSDLPRAAVVGSASLRRQAMVKRLRPDLRVTLLRGNVGTRLKKLEAGDVDATLLAMAGLNRLGLAHHATAALALDDFVPAVGQGAIAVTVRADDEATHEAVARICDAATGAAVAAERAFLAVLDGSCRTPDRRPRTALGWRAPLCRIGAAAGRVGSHRGGAHRRGERRDADRTRRRDRDQRAHAARLSDRVSACAFSWSGPRPTRGARRRGSPPAGTRRCWPRCCASQRPASPRRRNASTPSR